MVRAAFDPTQPPLGNNSFKLRIGSSTYRVGPESGIVLAHALLKAKKYDLAAKICEILLRWNPHDCGVAVLLACCKAGLGDYATCNRILQALFEGDNLQLAEHLQTALLFHELGMKSAAVSELAAVTNDLPDMPILWLLLGDEYAAMGNRAKATLCWRLAIDRDTRGGPVASSARRQMTRLPAAIPNSQPKTGDSSPKGG